jgi:hypothetical protein
MIPRGRGKSQAGDYLINSANYMLSADSFYMYQIQVVFRLVALYASRLAFGTCAERALNCSPAPESGPGRYGPADSLTPFGIAHELPETGDRPLILPTDGPYGHRALSHVDFSQTSRTHEMRKEGRTMDLHKTVTGNNRIPSPVSSVENVITDRIKKFLYRKVQKSNRSHFCLFLLFLLVARHSQAV